MPDFSIEDNEHNLGAKVICGVDEAGRGPLCGPVVAGAVVINQKTYPSDRLKGLNDSKKLSAKKRDEFFDIITEYLLFGVGIVDCKKIDEVNILNATKLAMKLATEDLQSKYSEKIDCVLVDGNQKFDFNAKILPIVKGDLKSLSIAAASVVAKVTRDRIMQKLDESFPQYKWGKNSGYGTKEHLAAIEEFGVTEHHRRSFAPIKFMV